MLTHLYIRDFAIIDRAEIEFGAGMTAMTGETGAGKSIQIDALNLVLGSRPGTRVVRHGSDRCDITAGFDVSRHTLVTDWLNENDLDDNGECLLRRIITHDGRSKGYINGQPVAMQQLRALGDMLVDIHGQHEHQSLMKRDAQRQMLDDYADNKSVYEQTSQTFHQWKALCDEMESLRQASADRDARLDMLRYQVQELQALDFKANELSTLEEEHTRLANVQHLLDGCQQSLDTLYDNETGSAASIINQASASLEELQTFDSHLSPIAEILKSAGIQVQEAATELRHYLASLEMEPARLDEIDQRLSTIHELSRKHRVFPKELPALQETLQTELASLENADNRLEQLQQEINDTAKRYHSHATALTKSRQQAAQELADKVTEDMQLLGMEGGSFHIDLHPLDTDQLSAHGLETIAFQVCTNPGQPAQPLAKIASGGELSRISLAIQVATIQRGHHVPTLIFDEVDVGIGGGVAEIVGQQLRLLGERYQVLCVTHLPQVAALGHHHFRIDKQTTKESTHISIDGLEGEERQLEIARMLGGVEITAQTMAHAGEMMQRAQKPKRRKKTPPETATA